MKVLKEIGKYILILVIIVAILFCATKLLMPKYMTGIREGAMIAEYYDNAGDNDVVFVGDCEVYENFSPITLWKEYGITSFIRGSAQQLIWQSYYLMEETFQYEKPEVVVFNVLSMKYNTPQSEAYNRMTLDGMKLSPIKLKAAKASMTSEEELISYVIPLIRYHSRWSELTAEDFQYWFKTNQVTHNGYLMRVDVKPVDGLAQYYEENKDKDVSLSYDELYNIGFIEPDRFRDKDHFGENAYKYLDMMRELCEKEGVELVLIKSPSIYPYWYEEWDQEIEEYSKKYNLKYVNMLDYLDEMSIDFTTDTYDKGLHMNLQGAEKATKWLGNYLKENCGLQDRRDDKKLEAAWNKRIKFYEDMKADQERELKEYGYLKSYTIN